MVGEFGSVKFRRPAGDRGEIGHRERVDELRIGPGQFDLERETVDLAETGAAPVIDGKVVFRRFARGIAEGVEPLDLAADEPVSGRANARIGQPQNGKDQIVGGDFPRGAAGEARRRLEQQVVTQTAAVGFPVGGKLRHRGQHGRFERVGTPGVVVLQRRVVERGGHILAGGIGGERGIERGDLPAGRDPHHAFAGFFGRTSAPGQQQRAREDRRQQRETHLSRPRAVF